MTTFLIIGSIAVVIGAYFALDWWLAGRNTKRTIGREHDGQARSASGEYGVIERKAMQHKKGPYI